MCLEIGQYFILIPVFYVGWVFFAFTMTIWREVNKLSVSVLQLERDSLKNILDN